MCEVLENIRKFFSHIVFVSLISGFSVFCCLFTSSRGENAENYIVVDTRFIPLPHRLPVLLQLMTSHAQKMGRMQRVHILGCSSSRRKGKNIFIIFSLVCVVNVSQVKSVFRRALTYSGRSYSTFNTAFSLSKLPFEQPATQFSILKIIFD